MGILDWFREKIRRPEIREMSMSVLIDRTDTGQHLLRFHKYVDGQEIPITDLAPLLRYGYREEVEGSSGPIIYTVSEKDRQTLLAIKSMNPALGNDGTLRFDFAPAILNYLRAKDNLDETIASKRLRIRDKPPQPGLAVDLVPGQGLVVKTGYVVEDGQEVVPAESFSKTADGRHMFADNTFYPRPEKPNQKTERLLKKPISRVPVDRVPQFLQQDLESLRKDFLVRLSDNAKQIKIVNDPLRPTAVVDYDPKRGLTIESGYDLGDGQITPPEALARTADGAYAIGQDGYYALPRHLGGERQAQATVQGQVIPTERIPTFIKHQMEDLLDGHSIRLSDSAKQIRIVDEPLERLATIAYDSQQGLDVQTGYVVGENVVPAGRLQTTVDGSYAILGTEFVALPGNLTKTAEDYLKTSRHRIPKDHIPRFFRKDLPQLEDAFSVELADSAKSIQILDEPLKPLATIDFDPERGLEVQTGYVVEGKEDFITDGELSKTADGNYAIFGDTFSALPSDLSSTAQDYLRRARRQIPTENVPEFFEQDLPFLQEAFETELTAEAQKIQIVDEPLKPTARIDFDPEEGLSVRTGYRLAESEELTSDSDLRKTADGRYYIDDYTFSALPPDLSDKGQTLLDNPHHQVPLEDTPSFLHDITSLEDSFSKEWTDAATRVAIVDEPLRPKAKIDFDPQQGVTVQTGYDIENTGQITPADQLRKTFDGKYVIAGDTFMALPEDLSPKAQSWLKDPYHEIPIANVPEFFLRDLLLLKNEFTAVLTAPAEEIRIIEDSMQPVVNISREQGGWLNFDVGYEAGDVSLPPGLITPQMEETYVRTDDSTWVKVDRKVATEVDREFGKLEAEVADSGYRVPIFRFASLEEFIESIGGTAKADEAYQEFLDQLSGFKADETFQLSARAETDLAHAGVSMRPYQRAGVHWLDWLYTNHLHGVLADDMGLGKTLQTICVLRRAYEKSLERQHSLILAPKSVLYHWQRELNRFYPQMRVYRYHGPFRRRNLLRSVEPIIFLTTYSTAANDVDHLKVVPFYYMILDEATYIKNPDAKRTRAIKELNAAHRVALTGTPVENRPAELWSLFDFLMPDYLGKYGTFKREFEERIASGNRRTAEKLGKRVGPFMLRRTKVEVASDLPEKIEIDEWCSLTSEQRQLYGGLQDQVKRLRRALQRGENVSYATSILPVLTKLKQICDHPGIVTADKTPIDGRSEKFDWITSKIDGIQRIGEQTVIFSHFLGMLDFLESAVQKKGIPWIRIDGSTNNRQQLIDRFNEGRARVALCSLLAAGHGINMTAANHVIHADRWWNPAREDQATDRVHRIGQDKTVYVYRILVEGTLEERIDSLLDKKRDMADQIVGAATEGPRQWTREELIELLSPFDGHTMDRDSAPRPPRLRSHPEPEPVSEKPSEERVPSKQPTPQPEEIREVPAEPREPAVHRIAKAQAPLSDQLVHIMALSERSDMDAINELVTALNTTDNNIRWLAGSSLIRIGGQQTVAALADFLERPSALDAGRLEAIKVLGKIGGSKARAVLLRVTSNKDAAESVRDAGEKALLTLAG